MSDLPLVPFTHGDMISVAKAAREVGVSEETIRRWCAKFGIGRRYRHAYSATKWQVSLPALRMVAAEDWDALEAFRGGDRTSDLVAHYIHRLEPA